LTRNGPAAAQMREWRTVLPGRLNIDAAGLSRLSENERLLALCRLEYDALRLWAAATRNGREKIESRVRDIQTAPIPAEMTASIRTKFDEVLALIGERSRSGELPPISPDALRSVAEMFNEFLDQTVRIGPQAALLGRLSVAGYTKTEQLRLTRDQLVSRCLFERQVRSVARDLLNASRDEEESLARTLDLGDCPGAWLEWRLRHCVGQGSFEPRPSHDYDAQRLAYLPYVDLLFTDKEMVEFVRQVQADASTALRVRACRPPVAIPSTLDALESALGILIPSDRGH